MPNDFGRILGEKQINKLQIRAEILTILSKFQTSPEIKAGNLDEVLSVLLKVEDKKAILDVLLKEFIRANEPKALFISVLMLRVCDKKAIEAELWQLLEDKKIDDSAKSQVLALLRDLGKSVDYETLGQFFDNPDEVVDADTKRLLDTAIINPEAQIDFMDFLSALSLSDSKILVQSLGQDYSSDELANILTPVFLTQPSSALGKIAAELLGETKSQLAFAILTQSLDFIEDEEALAIVKKSISTLKLAGIREDNTQEYYEDLLSASKPYQFYTSYPDGGSNQALIFSRLNEETEKVQMFAVVVNYKVGIVDCFGFNEIGQDEFERIVLRFYNKSNRVYISPSQLKSVLDKAEKFSRKLSPNGKLSYEYICWKMILSDISAEPVPYEFLLEHEFDKHKIIQEELECIYLIDVVQKWFFDPSYSEAFKDLLEGLDGEFLQNKFDIDLEKTVQEKFPLIFDKTESQLLKQRVIASAYLKYLQDEKPIAQMLWALYFDEAALGELQKNILRKSIYEYYVGLKHKLEHVANTSNIFEMKNKTKATQLSLKQLEVIIFRIESAWVDGL